MEDKNKQLKSIWGVWWASFRKWFYPVWLIYETSVRFYDYALSVHHYFLEEQNYIATYIGDIGTQVLNLFCSVSTFLICSVFLTLPTGFLLYKLFKVDNLTGTRFEDKLKPIF